MPKDFPIALYREDQDAPIYVMSEADEEAKRGLGWRSYNEIPRKAWPQLRYRADGAIRNVHTPEEDAALGPEWSAEKPQTAPLPPGVISTAASDRQDAELEVLRHQIREQGEQIEKLVALVGELTNTKSAAKGKKTAA